jgi:excisionase family DNA binding protein
MGGTVEALLTLKQIAEYLNVSAKTVRRLIARRGLPHVRFGRVLRFDRGDVFRWLQARKEV